MKRQNGCRQIERTPAQREASVRAVLQCVSVLNDYQSLLRDIDSDVDSKGRCRVPKEALAERAYEAESAMRVLTRHGLDAMNELRDTGRLAQGSGELFRKLDGKAFNISDALEKCRSECQRLGDVDLSFFELVSRALEERGLRATVKRGRPELSGKGLDGEKRQVAIEFGTREWSLGRISSAQFFGANRTPERFATAIPVFSPETCHHRERVVGKLKTPIVEAYAAALSGMASANQSMYRHARQVEAFGRGGIRGNDPVTVIAAIIIVVGVVLLGIGIATGDEFLIAAGIIVIVGGICVAVGLCTLVLAILIPVGA